MCIASLIRFPIGLENKKTQMNILNKQVRKFQNSKYTFECLWTHEQLPLNEMYDVKENKYQIQTII